MQSTPSIPDTDLQRLQRRVALFAGAMAGFGSLAAIAQLAIAPLDYSSGAGIATLVAGTMVASATAVMGLRSRPSLRLLRVIEAAALVVGATVLAVIGREMAAIVPRIVSEAGVDERLGGPAAMLLGSLEVYVALGLTSALGNLFLIRAALVPSGPRRTLLLTVLIGYTALVVMATGVHPLQPGWLVADAGPGVDDYAEGGQHGALVDRRRIGGWISARNIGTLASERREASRTRRRRRIRDTGLGACAAWDGLGRPQEADPDAEQTAGVSWRPTAAGLRRR